MQPSYGTFGQTMPDFATWDPYAQGTGLSDKGGGGFNWQAAGQVATGIGGTLSSLFNAIGAGKAARAQQSMTEAEIARLQMQAQARAQAQMMGLEQQQMAARAAQQRTIVLVGGTVLTVAVVGGIGLLALRMAKKR